MPRRTGFTLVEVLVAVAILATVSATVAIVLGTGVESWRTASRLAETGHDGEAVLEQVMLAMRSACYATDGELSDDYGFQLENDGEGVKAHDTVSWTKIGNALVGEDVPWAGSPHRVRLYVDDDGPDGPGLYAAAWQLVGQPEDFDPDEDPVPVLLSDIATGLDVMMLDPGKAITPGEPYEWTDEWDNSNRIPYRVMVTLALQPNEKGGEDQALVRTTDIPLADLSWVPTDLNGDKREGDGTERTGETGEAERAGGTGGIGGSRRRAGPTGTSGGAGETGGIGGSRRRAGPTGTGGAGETGGIDGPRRRAGPTETGGLRIAGGGFRGVE